MTCLMVFLFLESLNQAANAAIAANVGAGRLLLASQQLRECREANNPYKNSWMPGLAPANLQWAPDPCAEQEEALQNLMKQGAAEGNQVATQQLGGAPAPQLAESTDPTPNTDPAIPMNEYVVPTQGAQNQWSPIVPEDVMDMILDNYPEDAEPPEEMMLDEILEHMLYYIMWCPWGQPGTKNAKWKLIYKPINSQWVGNWTPR